MMPGMENIGLRWRQIRFNPLRSLTPVRLASALDSSAAGWLREAALIYETIEQREAIVRSVMTKRRAAVARRDWQVITPDPDHPNAEAHKATLEYFYNNLSVTDATDLNVRTGMSGLLRQMMDAIIQKYAVHEIVWQPGPEGLTAELRRVPLYFFENRSGRLRFIGPENRADGMPLEEDGWMITVADGLGEALSICYMFKRLAIQDALAFSEKFSVPGVLGRTSAAKDTPEGNAMRDSVIAYANEWIGVNYSDDGSIKDPIQVIQTPGGGTNLPCMTLAEYMDRMISVLVRGGDASTIMKQDGTGSSVQQDETDALLEDDCAMVSETLQIQLDRLVIKMVHGDEAPAAYIVVNPPSNQDMTSDLAIDEGLARLGVVQAPEDLAERYGRETLDEETQDSREEEAKRGDAKDAGVDAEEDLKAAENYDSSQPRIPKLNPGGGQWTDEEIFGGNGVPHQVDKELIGKGYDGNDFSGEIYHSDPNPPPLSFKLRQKVANEADDGEMDQEISAIRAALTADLQPLGEALAGALQAGDLPAMQAALRKISENMPELAGDAANLAEVLAGQFTGAFLGDDAEEVANGDFMGHPYRGNQWEGDWKSNGLLPAAKIAADPGHAPVKTYLAAARLIAEETVYNDQGQPVKFTAALLDHWSDKPRAEQQQRLTELDDATNAVRHPHEVWSKGGQTTYLRKYTGNGPTRWMAVFVPKDITKTYFSSDRTNKADDVLRQGKLLRKR